ncbi:MAG TPA: DUF4349 domain-containing protein [Dehalococcoidales bacterium]|nr:DUF4349 domain-containing protein [Dehalococcoidales bacterium]
MKKIAMALMLVILILIPAACAGAPQEAGAPSMIAPTAPAPAPAAPAEGILPGKDYTSEGMPGTTQERMIIRTGDMSLVVADVMQARDGVAQLAVSLNGYVVSSRIWGEEQEMRGQISIRVPDEQFEPALTKLRELAIRVNSESTDSQDVTEEYIDLEARLKNAEATESQYLTLLDRATKVEDILNIYDSLSRVRTEIEQIKGRMQYLERTTSMSYISVRLEPEATARPLARAGWSMLEEFKSAIRGIAVFGQWLGTVAIWLVIFVPLWGAIIGVIYYLRRRRKKA